MKILGCLLMFFLFSYLGIHGANQIDRRIRQLKSLEKALFFMKREIDYRLSPLGETLLQTAKRTEHPWCLFFESAGKSFQENPMQGFMSPDEIFDREIQKIQGYHSWEKDLEVLKRLGKNFGELDKEMQLMQLTMATEEIKELLSEAQEEKQIKGKLYRTLGVCMGILSVILVV